MILVDTINCYKSSWNRALTAIVPYGKVVLGSNARYNARYNWTLILQRKGALYGIFTLYSSMNEARIKPACRVIIMRKY